MDKVTSVRRNSTWYVAKAIYEADHPNHLDHNYLRWEGRDKTIKDRYIKLAHAAKVKIAQQEQI